jgi:hypothetical protein
VVAALPAIIKELKNLGSSGTTTRDHRIVLKVEHRTNELLVNGRRETERRSAMNAHRFVQL